MDKIIDKLAQKIEVKDMIKINNEPEESRLSDTMHTESVKVYRNVQALLEKQTEDISEKIDSIFSEIKNLKTSNVNYTWILILLIANLSLGITILILLFS